MRGALYFDTRYGSTGKVSEWIISGIECASVIPVRINSQISPSQKKVLGSAGCLNYDFYIIGSPIFIGKPLQSIIDFIEFHRCELMEKEVFLFITSWAQSTEYNAECEKFIDLLKFHLNPCIPVLTRSLPGRLCMDRISQRDRKVMRRLLRRIDTMSEEFQSQKIIFNDQTSKELSERFGCDINEQLKCKGNLL